MRRFTPPTNALSKKLESDVRAVAPHFIYYDFIRIRKMLRKTPAMAAKVSDRFWEIGDIVKVQEEWEAKC